MNMCNSYLGGKYLESTPGTRTRAPVALSAFSIKVSCGRIVHLVDEVVGSSEPDQLAVYRQ